MTFEQPQGRDAVVADALTIAIVVPLLAATSIVGRARTIAERRGHFRRRREARQKAWQERGSGDEARRGGLGHTPSIAIAKAEADAKGYRLAAALRRDAGDTTAADDLEALAARCDTQAARYRRQFRQGTA